LCPYAVSGGDWFPFYTLTQVNTSSRKQKFIEGYSAGGGKATWRHSDPLQWLRFAQLGQKIPHSLSLSFIFLE
jgi:hypothetical protein